MSISRYLFSAYICHTLMSESLYIVKFELLK